MFEEMLKKELAEKGSEDRVIMPVSPVKKEEKKAVERSSEKKPFLKRKPNPIATSATSVKKSTKYQYFRNPKREPKSSTTPSHKKALSEFTGSGKKRYLQKGQGKGGGKGLNSSEVLDVNQSISSARRSKPVNETFDGLL